MEFAIEIGREDDGRWFAVIDAMPGVMAYGESRQEAECKVQALALRVLADELERDNETVEHLHLEAA